MTKMAFDCLGVGDTIPSLIVKPIPIDFARKFGLDDVLAHGMPIMACAGRMLTDRVPQTALQRFGVRFSAIEFAGEAVLRLAN